MLKSIGALTDVNNSSSNNNPQQQPPATNNSSQNNSSNNNNNLNTSGANPTPAPRIARHQNGRCEPDSGISSARSTGTVPWSQGESGLPVLTVQNVDAEQNSGAHEEHQV